MASADGPLKAMVQNIAKKKPSPAENPAAAGDFANFPDIDTVLSGGEPSKKSKKKLSVERIYQKKTQHEHILLRPDTYIGSVEKVTQVREEVAKESGVFIPRQQLMSPPYMRADPFFGPAPRAMIGHLQIPSGMADIFAPLPPPYMGGGMRPFKEKSSNFSQYHDDGKSYCSDLNDDDESSAMNWSYHGGDGGTGGGRDGGGEKMQNSRRGNHDKTSSFFHMTHSGPLTKYTARSSKPVAKAPLIPTSASTGMYDPYQQPPQQHQPQQLQTYAPSEHQHQHGLGAISKLNTTFRVDEPVFEWTKTTAKSPTIQVKLHTAAPKNIATPCRAQCVPVNVVPEKAKGVPVPKVMGTPGRVPVTQASETQNSVRYTTYSTPSTAKKSLAAVGVTPAGMSRVPVTQTTPYRDPIFMQYTINATPSAGIVNQNTVGMSSVGPGRVWVTQATATPYHGPNLLRRTIYATPSENRTSVTSARRTLPPPQRVAVSEAKPGKSLTKSGADKVQKLLNFKEEDDKHGNTE